MFEYNIPKRGLGQKLDEFVRKSIWSLLLITIFCLTVAQADVIVPPGLEVKESSIPKAGRGVFAKCVIPKHDFFGPFVGKKIPAEEAKKYKDSLYMWEVRTD